MDLLYTYYNLYNHDNITIFLLRHELLYVLLDNFSLSEDIFFSITTSISR